ncbi:MAG: hypothetical protein DSZ29_06210 [Aquificaceae bacterium]|nr:MAG: hypothetical protein DSZ29_06210 [Aquificaceae bacterium]
MRKLIIVSSFCFLLSACTGDDLDTPIKTCKAITAVLIHAQVPETVKATQKETGDVQVTTLDFNLSDEKETVNVVCSYKLAEVGQEASEDLFGKYERVPSKMVINGNNVVQKDLMRAINTATLQAGKKALKDANNYLQKQ